MGFISFVIALFKGKINKAPKLKEVTHDQFKSDAQELSEEELDELVQILEESISLYEIKIKFAIANKEVTLKELLKMKEPLGNLYASVYSTDGDLLIDFSVPAEFFETAEVIDEGEEMIHVGELSDEYVDHMHEEKHENAQKELK